MKQPPTKKAASTKAQKPKTKVNAKQAAAISSTQLATNHISTPTNLPICIIDNGGWTVKYGLVDGTNNDTNIQMSSMYNATARPPLQLTLLAGDEITSTMKNLGQLTWSNSCERGMVCDGETQLRVWARILEVLNVIPNVSNVMGGGSGNFLASIAASRRGKKPVVQQQSTTQTQAYTSNNCAFLLLEPPFVPSTISENIDNILFRELGMARVARLLGPCMAAVKYISFCEQQETTPTTTTNNTDNVKWINDNTECCCVVDSGYSFTHIVPTQNNGEAIDTAIRRLNVGGKVLTNLLKESVTYRQWNMMDEYHIVNDAKEQLCFVSDSFDKEMKYAKSTRKGIRWFDREYLLPDFVNTFKGSIRLPEPLQRKNEMAEMEKIKKELDRLNDEKERQELEDEARELAMEVDENEADDKTSAEEPNAAKRKKKSKSKKEKKNKKSRKKSKNPKNADNSDEEMDGASDYDDDDSDEESDQQRLQRLKAMRDAERKRREQESLEHQAIAMSVERFAIPEVLFTPTDIGLNCGGIAEAIVESIEACDPVLRAAMYHNVLLVGGNAKISGYAKRVESELRKLAPTNYEVRVYLPDDPVSYAWEGAKLFASQPGFQERFSVDRMSWESMKQGGMNQQDIWNKRMFNPSRVGQK